MEQTLSELTILQPTAPITATSEPQVSPIVKYRERLLCIIAAGQSKAFLGKNFTLEYIEKASDKEIEK